MRGLVLMLALAEIDAFTCLSRFGFLQKPRQPVPRDPKYCEDRSMTSYPFLLAAPPGTRGGVRGGAA